MNQWLRVKELFHSALEREPSQRAAFLDAACDDEPAVRAEVDRLLVAHDQAGPFIEQSPVVVPQRVIGHYEVDGVIGSGGMGTIIVKCLEKDPSARYQTAGDVFAALQDASVDAEAATSQPLCRRSRNSHFSCFAGSTRLR